MWYSIFVRHWPDGYTLPIWEWEGDTETPRAAMALLTKIRLADKLAVVRVDRIRKTNWERANVGEIP